MCEKKSSTSSGLKPNTRIHSGEKPFHWNICEKTFSTSSGLKTHTRIHSGEKPFHCNICEKKFSTSCGLKTHTRIHSGEKPFYYDIVEKKFINSGGLNRHTRIHSGEKPFKCLNLWKEVYTLQIVVIFTNTSDYILVRNLSDVKYVRNSLHREVGLINTPEYIKARKFQNKTEKPFLHEIIRKG